MTETADTPLSPEEMERVQAAFARVPYLPLLGIRLGEVRRGAAVLHMEARHELTQNSGLLHGGAIASLLDTAAAFATLTLLKSGQTTATADLTIHYLRPVFHGNVTAHARVLRAGRNIATLTVDVTDDSDKIVATAITTYVIKT